MGSGNEKMSCRRKSDCNSDQAEAPVYHERQSRQLCALHALNNLFQDQNAFTKKDLDEICVRLSSREYINPHRSMLGLGNYDVNVIMAALQSKQCDTIWFDKRRDPHHLNFRNIKGFIMNVPTDLKWGPLVIPWQRRHWISVRDIGGQYYDLDSRLDTPKVLGSSKELATWLQEEIKTKDKEVLIVVAQSADNNSIWCQECSALTANGPKSIS